MDSRAPALTLMLILPPANGDVALGELPAPLVQSIFARVTSSISGSFVSRAEVAELADAHGSGPCTRKGVGVRVPSSAPTSSALMSAKVDLYNNAYGNYGEDVYRQVRLDTYGEDLGQTSWATSAESAEIPQLLGLTSNSYVLEVGCGSGRYALQLAETAGCEILGVDINSSGI